MGDRLCGFGCRSGVGFARSRSKHPRAAYTARVLVGLYQEHTKELKIVEENRVGDALVVVVEVRVDEQALDALLAKRLSSKTSVANPTPFWIEMAGGGGAASGSYRRLVQDSTLHKAYMLVNILSPNARRNALGAAGLSTYFQELDGGPVGVGRVVAATEFANGLGMGASLNYNALPVRDALRFQFGTVGWGGGLPGKGYPPPLSCSGCPNIFLLDPISPEYLTLVRGRDFLVRSDTANADFYALRGPRTSLWRPYLKLSFGFVASGRSATIHGGVRYQVNQHNGISILAEVYGGGVEFDRRYGGEQWMRVAGVYFGVGLYLYDG